MVDSVFGELVSPDVFPANREIHSENAKICALELILRQIYKFIQQVIVKFRRQTNRGNFRATQAILSASSGNQDALDQARTQEVQNAGWSSGTGVSKVCSKKT